MATPSDSDSPPWRKPRKTRKAEPSTQSTSGVASRRSSEESMPAAVERPGEQGDRAEKGEIGERFPDDWVGVVGPEGEHREAAACGQRDRQEHGYAAHAAPRREQAGGGAWQSGQGKVRREDREQLSTCHPRQIRITPGRLAPMADQTTPVEAPSGAGDQIEYGAFYYRHDCGIPYERNDHWLSFFEKVADSIVREFQPGLGPRRRLRHGIPGRGAAQPRGRGPRGRHLRVRDLTRSTTRSPSTAGSPAWPSRWSAATT